MNDVIKVPFVIRGEVIEDCTVEFGGRHGGAKFIAPDLAAYINDLLLRQPSKMSDLYTLTMEDIFDYLSALGQRLDVRENKYLQQSFALASKTSGLSDSILRYYYDAIPYFFEKSEVREQAERMVGIDYMEGWVPLPSTLSDKETTKVRAFGARGVHVIAGNVPMVSVATVIRNAFTRSDAIIKTPSNDPLTATAIAQTMVDMDPDHPLTKHLSVVYWKGGDEQIENRIYDPLSIEKIVAWGGFAGIKSVVKYLQPGLDLITLDPKHSSSMIGAEAFADDETLQHVARRLALDIGAMNQEGCVNSRVTYVHCGTDEAGLERINKLGALAFDALQKLPTYLSTPHKDFDSELKDEIDAISYSSDEYLVYGGKKNEGAIIVSQMDSPVDFARQLGCRVGNLVPVDDLETAIKSVNSYTQTIGMYPESLKQELKDRLAYQGAQRLVSLGAAAIFEDAATPQDGIEPVRRMCKWIVEQTSDGQALETVALSGAEDASSQAIRTIGSVV